MKTKYEQVCMPFPLKSQCRIYILTFPLRTGGQQQKNEIVAYCKVVTATLVENICSSNIRENAQNVCVQGRLNALPAPIPLKSSNFILQVRAQLSPPLVSHHPHYQGAPGPPSCPTAPLEHLPHSWDHLHFLCLLPFFKTEKTVTCFFLLFLVSGKGERCLST